MWVFRGVSVMSVYVIYMSICSECVCLNCEMHTIDKIYFYSFSAPQSLTMVCMNYKMVLF